MSKHQKTDTSGRGMKGTPMRQWGEASYDPTTGRAASSLEQSGARTSHDGESISPNRQLPKEGNGFQARDRRATQDPTPVHRRQIG